VKLALKPAPTKHDDVNEIRHINLKIQEEKLMAYKYYDTLLDPSVRGEMLKRVLVQPILKQYGVIHLDIKRRRSGFSKYYVLVV